MTDKQKAAGGNLAAFDNELHHHVSSPQYFCMCEACRGDSRIINVGRVHYGLCRARRQFWKIGESFFNGHLLEDERVWQRNADLLASYSKVERCQ